MVEQGTHDELMKMEGLYYSMSQQQALLEGSEGSGKDLSAAQAS